MKDWNFFLALSLRPFLLVVGVS